MRDKKMMIAIIFILLIAGYAVYREQQKNLNIQPLLEEMESKSSK